jgi:hypothetical protein
VPLSKPQWRNTETGFGSQSSVLALRSHNPKLPAIMIRTRNTAATPTGFLDIVSNDSPVFHFCGLLTLNLV